MHGQVLLETLTFTLFAAVALQVLASRLRVPAIVLLLLGGILMGPEALHLIDPSSLGGGLTTVVSMAVAVILFEGGLSLEVEGFRLAGSVINRMLTLGVLVTWAGTAGLIVAFYDYDGTFAVMAASLTIVTGPTVIGPILRRVRVSERLHQILHWEGVLIDPIGVFLALATYEFVQSQAAGAPVLHFAARLALAIPLGAAAGWAIGWVLRHDWLDEEWDNLAVLASALLLYGLCDAVLVESGLMAVTVAGFVLGRQHSRRVKRIKKFKLDITQLAIGMVFILLSARLEIAVFGRLGVGGIVLLLGVMAVIRPLNIAVSTIGSALPNRERAFLAFLAPRGIVAASMASLFTLRLGEQPAYANSAWFLEAFTYAVIGATVVIQGLGAPLMARLLKVEEKERRTWLIVGARFFGQDLAAALKSAGVPSLLVDNNPRHVREAKRRGLIAVEADILDVRLFDDTRFVDVGAMLCATGNSVLDELACHRWGEILGENRCYRLWSDTQGPEDDDASGGVQRGIPVWPTIAGLRELESDLEAGDAVIELAELSGLESLDGQEAKRLFDVGATGASLVPNEPSVGSEDARRVVVLSRQERPRYSPVRDVVTIDEPQPTLRGVLSHLLDQVAVFQPDVDASGLLEAMIEREVAMSSYVGKGVAIPHAYCGKTGDPLSIVGRLPEPLDLKGFDAQPVHLVFLLVSPEGEAQRHLEALGQLARLAADDDLLDRLRDASDDDEALRLVRAEHREQWTRKTAAGEAGGAAPA